MFVTVCYFNAVESFLLELNGEGGLGPLLLFNPLWDCKQLKVLSSEMDPAEIRLIR
jgi:hypothetical protein